jgi:hypothetical protein
MHSLPRLLAGAQPSKHKKGFGFAILPSVFPSSNHRFFPDTRGGPLPLRPGSVSKSATGILDVRYLSAQSRKSRPSHGLHSLLGF